MLHDHAAAGLSLPKRRHAGAVLLWLSCACAAADTIATAGMQALPNLPGSDLPPPLQWQLGEQGATLAYKTRSEKWEATIDPFAGSGAAVAVDYGLLLTSKLGAGTSFRHEGDHSEIVANAVYAHRHNLRFRLAGAQLRTAGINLHADGGALSLRQSSYLLSARKYWPIERFVSDLGLAFYTVDASPSASSLQAALDETRSLDADEDRPASVTSGKMDGFMLNLGLRPTWQSRIELRREFSHVDYRPQSGARRSEFLSSGRISYQQHLDSCMQFRSGYSVGGDAGRLDLGLAKDNWNVSLSQDFNDTDSGTALYLSYKIPLGGRMRSDRTCATYADGAPPFSPIVDAALQRPQQFPREPIAVIETE